MKARTPKQVPSSMPEGPNFKDGIIAAGNLELGVWDLFEVSSLGFGAS
jgi:hypothetical protein